MKAVVTGGAGFLGSHVADALSARDIDVIIFDRQQSAYLQPGQQMYVGDILDSTALNDATAQADCVFHLAALGDLNLAKTKALDTARVNLMGTINALDASIKAGVKRFMFASTVYVYSREGGFYRCSKQAGESYVEEYARQHGLGYTMLRYGSLYGPRATDSNGVYRLLRSAAATGRIRHVGTPDDAREYVHVQDAAGLSVDALAPEYANQHLVITGHYPMRLGDLFTMFSEILGRGLDIEYVRPEPEHRDGHYRVTPYAYQPTLARKLTSNCYVDMGQGLLQILEQLRQEGTFGTSRTGGSS